MSIPRTIAVLAVSSTLALAQGWSQTAHLRTGATASVQLANVVPSVTVTNTRPVGDDVSAGFTLAAATAATGSNGQAHVDWYPSFAGQVAPVGFHAFTGGYVSVSQGIPFVATNVHANASTTVLVHLTPPAPTSGRLALRFDGDQSQIPGGSARIEVDVHADGTWDFDVASSHFWASSATKYHEVPIVVPASGLDVRVRSTTANSVNWLGGWTFAHASLAVRAEFHPHQAVVAPFDATGSSIWLGATHFPDDTVALALPATWPGLLVFGAQATVAAVPGIPTITQLVSIDAVVLANALTVPMPLLPPGSALYVQGLAIDPSGVPLSTGSVRAFWP